jgi:hypothetical protein
VTHELELVVIEQMVDIALRAGEEVVDANDVRALREQAIAEVRAEEAGAPGNQYARFKRHVPQLPQFRKIHTTAGRALHPAARPLYLRQESMGAS